jgi:hypothetical protein
MARAAARPTAERASDHCRRISDHLRPLRCAVRIPADGHGHCTRGDRRPDSERRFRTLDRGLARLQQRADARPRRHRQGSASDAGELPLGVRDRRRQAGRKPAAGHALPRRCVRSEREPRNVRLPSRGRVLRLPSADHDRALQRGDDGLAAPEGRHADDSEGQQARFLGAGDRRARGHELRRRRLPPPLEDVRSIDSPGWASRSSGRTSSSGQRVPPSRMRPSVMSPG